MAGGGSSSRALASHGSKLLAGSGVLYLLIGLSCCMSLLYISFGDMWEDFKRMDQMKETTQMGFVERNGTQLHLNGGPFYVNGWNSYWLMDQAVDEFSRNRVTTMFQMATKMGLTVCRTWAFNDGAYHALQVSLGRFDERVFKALDRVIAEARMHGVRLLLCLVNSLEAFGGKGQYVKWAWEDGIALTPSNDSFFYDQSIKSYFKIYLKTLLTRKNHLTGIEYRDDPTIFAWELINEPSCTSDPTGDNLQDWIEEMAAYIKTIDKKHLLTVGLEGFYGPSSGKKKRKINPTQWSGTIGSDFIRNSKIDAIDFASVHVYTDQWFEKRNLGFAEKVNYTAKWLESHIGDGDGELRKPVLFTEFGFSDKINKGYSHSQREAFYKEVLDILYDSAAGNRAGAGTFIWQLLVRGMEEYNDDYGFVPGDRPSLDAVIRDHSCRLGLLRYGIDSLNRRFRSIC